MAAGDISVWLGTTSGDWNTAGNWDGGVPASDEIAVFGPRATRAPDTNLDQNTVDLQGLIIKGYRYGLGTSGNPLIVSVSNVTTGNIFGTPTVEIDHSGSGSIFLDGSGETYDLVKVKNTGTGTVELGNATFTTLEPHGGVINVAATATVTNVKGTGSQLFIAYKSSAITLLEMSGGVITNERQMTTGDVSGGRLTLRGRDASTIATTLNVRGGRVDDQSEGSIGTLNGVAGVYDLSNSPQYSKSFTTKIMVYRGFQFINPRGVILDNGTLGTDPTREVVGPADGLGV